MDPARKLLIVEDNPGDLRLIIEMLHDSGSGIVAESFDTLAAAVDRLAVADVVEAMVSHRPYRPALGIDAALAEIERGVGRLYDAEVSRVCVALFREDHFQLST